MVEVLLILPYQLVVEFICGCAHQSWMDGPECADANAKKAKKNDKKSDKLKCYRCNLAGHFYMDCVRIGLVHTCHVVLYTL